MHGSKQQRGGVSASKSHQHTGSGGSKGTEVSEVTCCSKQVTNLQGFNTTRNVDFRKLPTTLNTNPIHTQQLLSKPSPDPFPSQSATKVSPRLGKDPSALIRWLRYSCGSQISAAPDGLKGPRVCESLAEMPAAEGRSPSPSAAGTLPARRAPSPGEHHHILPIPPHWGMAAWPSLLGSYKL